MENQYCQRHRTKTCYSREIKVLIHETNPELSYLVIKKEENAKLEDFHLLKVLGRGAFGKVMLVAKKDTEEIYAMKSIRKEDIIEKDQVEHTKTERRILEYVNLVFLSSYFIGGGGPHLAKLGSKK